MLQKGQGRRFKSGVGHFEAILLRFFEWVVPGGVREKERYVSLGLRLGNRKRLILGYWGGGLGAGRELRGRRSGRVKGMSFRSLKNQEKSR